MTLLFYWFIFTIYFSKFLKILMNLPLFIFRISLLSISFFNFFLSLTYFALLRRLVCFHKFFIDCFFLSKVNLSFISVFCSHFCTSFIFKSTLLQVKTPCLLNHIVLFESMKAIPQHLFFNQVL